MILERSNTKEFPSESFITINDETYNADVLIKYPLLKSDSFSTDKECVILFFSFIPETSRNFLFGRYYSSLSISDIEESQLDGAKPTYGLLFYKGQDFLNKYNSL